MSQGWSWDRVSGLPLLVYLLPSNLISVSRPCVYFPPSHHTQVSLSSVFIKTENGEKAKMGKNCGKKRPLFKTMEQHKKHMKVQEASKKFWSVPKKFHWKMFLLSMLVVVPTLAQGRSFVAWLSFRADGTPYVIIIVAAIGFWLDVVARFQVFTMACSSDIINSCHADRSSIDVDRSVHCVFVGLVSWRSLSFMLRRCLRTSVSCFAESARLPGARGSVCTAAAFDVSSGFSGLKVFATPGPLLVAACSA